VGKVMKVLESLPGTHDLLGRRCKGAPRRIEEGRNETTKDIDRGIIHQGKKKKEKYSMKF